ncbi:MAG: hypothetical protein E3J72_05125 [Planctomycetota bacterium]|nr:MAG: hypothetical protein E3J72_05125 [Planctomycetota bacterium]
MNKVRILVLAILFFLLVTPVTAKRTPRMYYTFHFGDNICSTFDIATQTRTQIPDCPRKVDYRGWDGWNGPPGPYDGGVVEYNARIYLANGTYYDTGNSMWSIFADKATDIYKFDNKMYLFGGKDGHLKRFRVYDPETETTTELGKLFSLHVASSIKLNDNSGIFSVITNQYFIYIYHFDTVSETWSELVAYDSNYGEKTYSAVYHNGIIYMMMNSGYTFHSYDVISKSWVTQKPSDMSAGKLTVYNGDIYSITPESSVYRYDTGVSAWIKLNSWAETKSSSRRIFCEGPDVIIDSSPASLISLQDMTNTDLGDVSSPLGKNRLFSGAARILYNNMVYMFGETYLISVPEKKRRRGPSLGCSK